MYYHRNDNSCKKEFSNAPKSCYGKTVNFKADIILFSGCLSIIQTFKHFTIKGFLFHK